MLWGSHISRELAWREFNWTEELSNRDISLSIKMGTMILRDLASRSARQTSLYYARRVQMMTDAIFDLDGNVFVRAVVFLRRRRKTRKWDFLPACLGECPTGKLFRREPSKMCCVSKEVARSFALTFGLTLAFLFDWSHWSISSQPWSPWQEHWRFEWHLLRV